MKTPLLIGIAGVKQSGKGTTFHFIKEWGLSLSLSARERGFADNVKWMLARIFMPKISMSDAIEWYDAMKEDPRAEIYFPHNPSDPRSLHSVTFRKAGQHFGTESGRDIMGGDFWAKALLPDYDSRHVEGWREAFMIPDPKGVEFYNIADLCGVTDLRFEEEYERLVHVCTHHEGERPLLVKVRNRAAEQKIIDEAKAAGREIHRSELGLDDSMFDYVINNDGTKEELALRVRYMMNEVYAQD